MLVGSGTRDHGLDLRDVEIRTTKDSGPGGQHRNKTESAVIATHVPTGISAKAAARHQGQNRTTALALLAARVKAQADAERSARLSHERRALAGTGQRGDKVRTYRVRDDVAMDHRTGAKARLRDVVAGRALVGSA